MQSVERQSVERHYVKQKYKNLDMYQFPLVSYYKFKSSYDKNYLFNRFGH